MNHDRFSRRGWLGGILGLIGFASAKTTFLGWLTSIGGVMPTTCESGVVSRSAYDANGNFVIYKYDDLGRLIQMTTWWKEPPVTTTYLYKV